MAEHIAITGLVATEPRSSILESGLQVTSFRLAANSRYFDRHKNSWVSSETNWFTVQAFRQLASNAGESISKGDRVVVTGKLKVRDWDNGERSGTSVEIEADAIGLDLTFGIGTMERNAVRVPSEDEQDLESELQPA